MGASDRIARDIREGVFPNQSTPRVMGVSRVADNPRTIMVSMSVEPTDDELRDFHDCLRDWDPRG